MGQCYGTNWIARAIIDSGLLMHRSGWRSIKSDGAEDIEGTEDALDLTQVWRGYCMVTAIWRCWRSDLTNQGPRKPLNLNAIKKAAWSGGVFDRYDLTLSAKRTPDDMLARNYLRLITLQVSGGSYPSLAHCIL